MNPRKAFFSFNLRQPVNQWLGIGLVSAMCLWVVVYYFVNSSQIIGDRFVQITAATQTQGATD